MIDYGFTAIRQLLRIAEQTISTNWIGTLGLRDGVAGVLGDTSSQSAKLQEPGGD